MKSVRLILIAVSGALLFTVTSCRKQVEKEIEGVWMKEASTLYSTVDEDSAIWTFQNGTLTINNLTSPLYSEEGNYTVITKKFKTFVRISGLNTFVGESNMNGDWQVIQYRKDKLTLSKPDRAMVVDPNPPYQALPIGEQEIGNILREFTRIQ